jgi:hypothetical protein
MVRRPLLILPGGALARGGGGAQPVDPTGHEGGPCTADGTCREGLVCLAGLCVQSRDRGWLDGYPVSDLPRFSESLRGDLGPDAGELAPDLGKPDLPGPKLDQGKPKLDQGSPDTCKTWSAYNCIATPPTPGVICHASCQGRAIWCDGTGRCYCTISGSSPCATGLPVSFANPCATCKAALETKGCCL